MNSEKNKVNKVTVATCCFDKDWKLVMTERYLKKVFSLFQYDFYEKMIVVNTEVDRKEIESTAHQLCNQHIIDKVVFASDIQDEVMNSFGINNFLFNERVFSRGQRKNSNLRSILKKIYSFYFSQKGKIVKKGIFEKIFDCSGYALGPLTAIYCAKGDYLLYFTEDCAMDEKMNAPEWIDWGISLCLAHDDYLAVRPGDLDLDSNWLDTLKKIGDFREAWTFTDRMFLAPVERLRGIDYNCVSVGIYPAYGGAGFEAKVFNYMRAVDARMLISEKTRYIHETEEYMSFVNNTLGDRK